MIERRGFLKLATTAIGSIVVTKYAEPFVLLTETHHDWIEDKGDYCIVRVPDFKTFSKESISKPTIFILGEMAIVKQVSVSGFANAYAPKGGNIKDCIFDASKSKTEKSRSILTVKGEGLVIEQINLIHNDLTNAAIFFQNGNYPVKKPIIGNYQFEGAR